jgi:hypothetical protein
MSVRRGAAVAALLAALAAGCGGGGSGSEQEAWAESVCEPFVEWRSEIEAVEEELRDAFESPTLGLGDTLREAGTRASEATQALQQQLGDVSAPPLEEDEEGADAAQVIDGLADSLRETRDTVTEELEALDSGSAAEITEALSLVAAQIAGALTQVQTTIDTLGGLTDELQSAFEDAASCEELRDR